jgi:hypothetical protein
MRQRSQENESGGVHWLILGVLGYRACFLPFLRCHFGTEMPGIAGLASIAVMWGYAVFVPEAAPAMAMFFACWLVLVILHRAEALKNGRDRHSRDSYPWLAMCVRPRPASMLMATGFEAAFLLLAGTLLTGLSPPLGAFVMGGGVPLVVKGVIDHTLHERRIRRMGDIDREMRDLAADYRERYGNRR